MPVNIKDRQRLQLDCLLVEAYLSINRHSDGKRNFAFFIKKNGEPVLVEFFWPNDIPPNEQGHKVVAFQKRPSPHLAASRISSSIELAEFLHRNGEVLPIMNGMMEKIYNYLLNAPNI